MNIHPSKKIDVNGELVDIDVEIIPLIKLMNDMPGVFTTFCCQGNKSIKRPYIHPYVAFCCKSKKSIHLIQKAVDKTKFTYLINWVSTNDDYVPKNCLKSQCYSLEFDDQKCKNKFYKNLKFIVGAGKPPSPCGRV